jgi:hypothetical protein
MMMMMSAPHRRPQYTFLFSSLLLWAMAKIHVAAQRAPRCDEFVRFDDFAENIELQTITEVTDATTGQGRITVQATLTGLGWIGIGWSADGMMIPGVSVMGTDCNIAKWNMNAYSYIDLEGVKPFPESQQTLSDTSFIQNETHSILRFTKPLIEDGELPLDATGNGNNIFLWAYGTNNFIGFHNAQGTREVPLTACEGGTVPVAPVSDDVVCNTATSTIPGGISAPVISIPYTSAPIAAPVIISIPYTSAPIAAPVIISIPYTSAPIAAPVIITVPYTSAPVTPSPVTAGPVTSSPVTAAPLTAAPTGVNITRTSSPFGVKPLSNNDTSSLGNGGIAGIAVGAGLIVLFGAIAALKTRKS